MKYVTRQAPMPPDAACRHLAVRVIEQAVRDLSASGASDADRESARGFLAGSPMLYQWCELANLNASWMIGRATRLMGPSAQLRMQVAATKLTSPRGDNADPSSKKAVRPKT